MLENPARNGEGHHWPNLKVTTGRILRTRGVRSIEEDVCTGKRKTRYAPDPWGILSAASKKSFGSHTSSEVRPELDTHQGEVGGAILGVVNREVALRGGKWLS
jgi:hypothetical protein